jgi:hypothetical protein
MTSPVGSDFDSPAATKIVELVKAGLSDPVELYPAVPNDFKKR